MSKEQGIVLRTNQEGWAYVVTERKDACAGCGASYCCIGADTGSKMLTCAINKIGASSGDLVTVTVQPGLVVKSAAIIYFIPILGFVGGAIVGAFVHSAVYLSESAAAILFGFCGLVLGYFLSSAVSKRMSKGSKLTPFISQIVVKGTEKSPYSIDPVCNMVVLTEESAATSIYRDTTYYFCSLRCKEAFDKAPERYWRGGDND